MSGNVCPTCNGNGTITSTTIDPITHDRVSQTRTCGGCNGTGTR